MDLKYSHVDVVVSNVDAAAKYFQDVLDFQPGPRKSWQREDFDVDFVVMANDSQRFILVEPREGNLRELLDKKGDGTIYRLCFTAEDLTQCHQDLVARGVQPEDENGRPIAANELQSPVGRPILWLPKMFGDLSIEILQR